VTAFSSSPATAACLVVIPAHNEAATVGAVVRAARAAIPADVLVVDDASTDATAAEARAAGATVLSPALQLGAWGATQTGLRYARHRGYARTLTMDADGQHHPDSLPALLDALDDGRTDVAIGSCEPRLSLTKRIAWGYFRGLTGIGVRDFTSGLRAYGPRALEVLASPQASLLDYQDIGVLMLLKARGLTLREVPATMSPRPVGGSRVFSSWPMVARYMVATTVLCLARVGADRNGRTDDTRSDMP
jgi:glycosyltransferase involved in cell wall biosynthesis